MEFEIYFKDLNPEAQQRLCKEWGATETDENWETCPLAIIEREPEESALDLFLSKADFPQDEPSLRFMDPCGASVIEVARAGAYPCGGGCNDINTSDNRCINEDICTAWEIYQEAL